MFSKIVRAPRSKRNVLTQAGLVTLVIVSAVLVVAAGTTKSTDAATTFSKPVPVAVAPNSAQQFGFNMALLGNDATVSSMGFGWVQYGVYWKDAEPTQGTFNWGDTDNIIRYAHDANIGVLIRVSRPPAWARDPGCSTVDTCPPSDPADFGRFVYQLAHHVRTSANRPPRVAYEIWNEPNTDIEWGNQCPDPARYAGLLQAAYPQIKAGDSTATVVGGVVTTVGERELPGCHTDDVTFLEQMYDAGAAPYFDVLSDHPYGFASAPEADPATGTNLVFRRAERHRQLMVDRGDGAKQIWATEMGWALNPSTVGAPCAQPDWYYIFNPAQQADYLVRAFQWAHSYWPWMGAMFVFNFDFNEAPWYDQCHPFRFWAVKGLPAQGALASIAHNPPATYTPVVDNAPVIAAVRYSAVAFNRDGGNLVVEVDASDADSTPIDTVQATVQFPGGGTQIFALTLVSGNTQSGTWRSDAIPISPNNGSDPVTYSITPSVIEAFPTRRTTTAPVQVINVTNTRFLDVPTDFWAYSYIEFLASQPTPAISGYTDGTFRPNNNTTRAQLTKIVVLGFGLPLSTPANAHFTDVPAGSTFYPYVETAYAQGLITGYACGGPNEPCDSQNRPYFRPNTNVTRAQISKIVVSAAGWNIVTPATATFTDVVAGSTFYGFIETAYSHQILGGYPCGGPNEPCDSQNRPYFRPTNNATRAQISKLVTLALTEPTPTPTSTVAPTQTRTPTSTRTSTPAPQSTATGTAVATASSTALVKPEMPNNK